MLLYIMVPVKRGVAKQPHRWYLQGTKTQKSVLIALSADKMGQKPRGAKLLLPSERQHILYRNFNFDWQTYTSDPRSEVPKFFTKKGQKSNLIQGRGPRVDLNVAFYPNILKSQINFRCILLNSMKNRTKGAWTLTTMDHDLDRWFIIYWFFNR